MALLLQRLFQLVQGLAHPGVVRFGVARHLMAEQLVEIVLQSRIGLGERLASPAFAAHTIRRTGGQLAGQFAASGRNRLRIHPRELGEPGDAALRQLQRKQAHQSPAHVLGRTLHDPIQTAAPFRIVQPWRAIPVGGQHPNRFPLPFHVPSIGKPSPHLDTFSKLFSNESLAVLSLITGVAQLVLEPGVSCSCSGTGAPVLFVRFFGSWRCGASVDDSGCRLHATATPG